MAYDDLLDSLMFAGVPLLAFSFLIFVGTLVDIWADTVAVRKATRGRPWLVYHRRVRGRVSDCQRN